MRSSSLDRLLAIRSFPGFRDVSPEALAPMARYARERSFDAGEVILEEGMPVRSLYCIVRGEVRVSRSGLPFRLIRSGQSFGALAALAGVQEGVTATVTRPTEALEVSFVDFETVLLEHFDLLTAMLREISRATLLERARLERGGYEGTAEEGTAPPGEMSLTEKLVSLKDALFISKHRVDALVDLARSSVEVRYHPGALLWEAGVHSSRITHVVSGIIDCVTPGGVRFDFGAGAFLGAMDSMNRGGRWFTATARTPVVALTFESDDFVDIIEDHSYMALDLLRGISDGFFNVLGKRRRYANDDSPL